MRSETLLEWRSKGKNKKSDAGEAYLRRYCQSVLQFLGFDVSKNRYV
jgi:hypothetical protein